MCPEHPDRYAASDAAPRSPDRPRDERAAAEAELVDRFHERLLVFAARRFPDTGSAEDVAQETLRRVIEAVREGRVRDPDALPAYVFQTARHVCLHGVRKARRRRRALLRMGGRASALGDDRRGDALDALVGEERRARVRAALQRLDASDRELLWMLYFEGLDTAEAADRLEVTRGALRVRKHRALKRLRAALREER
ncbi:MAG: RNA polymerase sigma factor [Gemmatimonadota bacterium]